MSAIQPDWKNRLGRKGASFVGPRFWLACMAALALLGCGCRSSYRFDHISFVPVVETDAAERPEWMVYDQAFADAIQAHWLRLLELENRVAPQDHGRVVLHVLLLPDGNLGEVDMVDNTEGKDFGVLCEKAVLDLVPFRHWTPRMQELFGEARSFQILFEFDDAGNGQVAYAEDWVVLSETQQPPSETRILIDSHR